MPPSIELEVRGLTKRYSPQVSVGPISFEVQQGEFFSLLGPSGCGKTTTLRCIAGFETLTEGSISLHGERLDVKPPRRRPRVPELRALSAPDGILQRRFRTAVAPARQSRDRRAGRPRVANC